MEGRRRGLLTAWVGWCMQAAKKARRSQEGTSSGPESMPSSASSGASSGPSSALLPVGSASRSLLLSPQSGVLLSPGSSILPEAEGSVIPTPKRISVPRATPESSCSAAAENIRIPPLRSPSRALDFSDSALAAGQRVSALEAAAEYLTRNQEETSGGSMTPVRREEGSRADPVRKVRKRLQSA